MRNVIDSGMGREMGTGEVTPPTGVSSIDDIRGRGSKERDTFGFTLFEVLLVTAISAIVLGSLGAWFFTTLRSQDVTRDQVATARLISLVSTDFVSDVAGAQFAVSSSTASFDDDDVTATLEDCPGGVGSVASGAQAILVLVTPQDRRIVYTLEDGDEGSKLYRRECPNLTGYLYPSADTSHIDDPSLRDPDYLENDAAALPQVTDTRLIVRGVSAASIATMESSCPQNPEQLSSSEVTIDPNDPDPSDLDPAVPDPNCQTVKLSLELESRSEPIVLEAVRRTDIYCAPGCPPTARFAASNMNPIKGTPITLDARSSFDRRKDYYLDVSPPPNPAAAEGNTENRLHYKWNIATKDAACPTDGWDIVGEIGQPDPPTPLDPDNPASPVNGDVMLPITFTIACDYDVTLTVWNNSGLSSSTTRTIKVHGIPPDVKILNSPIPIEIVRGQTVDFRSTVQTFEGDLDQTRSRWNFGDGTASEELTPAGSRSGFTCPVDGPTLCTSSDVLVPHTYNNAGTFVAVLTATDERNLTTTQIVQVIVRSEFLYVSKQGADTVTCGTVTPTFEPCETIPYAINRAANTGKTDILVGGGAYPAFTMADGINVRGGRDDRDGASSTWLYTPEYPTVINGEETSDRHAVTFDSIQKATTLADVVVEAGNTTVPTMALNAVVINGSKNVVLRNVHVRGGEGRNPTGLRIDGKTVNGSWTPSTVTLVDSTIESGLPKQSDAHDPNNRSAYGVRISGQSSIFVDGGQIRSEDALAGIPGTKGIDDPTSACEGTNGVNHSSSNVPGCTPDVDALGSTAGTYGGGGGGVGYCSADDGTKGGQVAGGGSGGLGGASGWGATPPPKAGLPGGGGGPGSESGAPGAAGSAEPIDPTVPGFNVELWESSQAGAGGAAPAGTGAGTPGGGGGGGGGSHLCPLWSYTGQSGGGGGGGGRPASSPGTGGYAGGGSFGIYAFGPDVSVTTSNGAVIKAGKGGDGGQGGEGGAGGQGGKGGRGAATTEGGDASSGGGGGGGSGAGGGGGGASGPSVGIYMAGADSVSPSTEGSSPSGSPGAQPGLPGPGGAGGQGGARGDDPGSKTSMDADRRGKPGLKGSSGLQGEDGEPGSPGMVCGLYVQSGGTADCFASSVKSITRIGPRTTNANGLGGDLSWLVTFEAPVENVQSEHFVLTGAGIDDLANLPITIAGTGSTRTVTVTGITAPSGHGTITLNIADVTGITSNDTQIEQPRPLPFRGETYVVDQEKPRVTSIARDMAQLTNSTAVSWTVTFSEPVTGVSGANFTPTTPNGGVIDPFTTSIDSLSPSVWLITINSGDGSGNLGIELDDVTGIKDEAGNELDDSNVPFVGDTYEIDKVAPEVISITRAPEGTAEPTNADSVQWFVQFSERVVGVAIDGSNNNFSLDPTVDGAEITGFLLENDLVTIDVDTGTGDGQLLLNLDQIGSIKDPAGNELADTLVGLVGTRPDPDDLRPNEPYLVDKTPPKVVSIKRPQDVGEYTNSTTTVDFVITFDEPVWDVTADQFELDPTMAGATVNLVTGVEGTKTRSVQVEFTGGVPELSASGFVQLNLTAAGAAGITDIAGNSLSAGHEGDELYQVDRARPDHSSAAASPDPYWKTNDVPKTPWPDPEPDHWHNQAKVTVTFTGTDPIVDEVSSGIGQICYTLDGADPVEFGTCEGHSEASPAAIDISTAGETVIRYYGVDRAGNAESSINEFRVRIDRDAPSAAIEIDSFATEPLPGGETRYIGYARLSFSATDTTGTAPRSGARGVWYTSDGSDPRTSNFRQWAELGDPGSPYNPLFIRQTGVHTIRYYAVDWAGNAEDERTRTVDVETRGPTITSVKLSGCAANPATIYDVPEVDADMVETYTDGGCVTLTAEGVAPIDDDLPVAAVGYYRCDWGVTACVDPSNRIGMVPRNPAIPIENETWAFETPQFQPPSSPSQDRGFVIVAAAEDIYEVMETVHRFVGRDMTPPQVHAAPIANGSR